MTMVLRVDHNRKKQEGDSVSAWHVQKQSPVWFLRAEQETRKSVRCGRRRSVCVLYQSSPTHCFAGRTTTA